MGKIDSTDLMDIRRVAVIGAGAAGVVTALRLLDHAGAPEVLLIDPVPGAGRGVAYRTQDPRHLLNASAGKMSAHADDPLDFARWLGVAPDEYVARGRFGDYLAETLARTAGSLRRVHARAVRIDVRPTGVTVRLDHDEPVVADAAVLAIGSFAPSCDWAPSRLRMSSRFIANPWQTVDVPDGDVLLVGTGLTMVDTALGMHRADHVVHAVSRHGLLPQPQATVTPCAPPELARPLTLTSLRQAVFRHIVTTGDWRAAIDSLRPVLAELWSELPPDDKHEFLRRDRRLWEVHRHRVPPQAASEIDRLRANGQLKVHVGEVLDAQEVPGGLRVSLSSGEDVTVAAVVNCTGPHEDVHNAGGLVGELIKSGVATPGPLRLGLDTDGGGRVRGGARLWVIGALRRGNLYETTAFPEIRAQAAALADSLLGPRQTVHRPRDLHGLPLSTSEEAAQAYRDGLMRILCVQNDAERAIGESVALDPGFAVGHAALSVLQRQRGAGREANQSLRAAKAAIGPHTTERERSFVAAVAGGDMLRHLRDHPRDSLAVSLVVPTIAFDGQVAGKDSWRLIEDLRPAYGDDWWYLGQLAFVRQDQGRWSEAAVLAARSLAEQPCSGHAVHATTHVYYETGEHRAGLSWLDSWLAERGPDACYRAHFSWHAGLHELALGDVDAVRRRYAGQLAPPAVEGPRALMDSASFLWRCSVTGAWREALPIEAVLDAAPAQWFVQPPNAFAGMHAAMALATARDTGRLTALEAFAKAHPDVGFSQAVAPLCAGLVAVVNENWSEAVSQLRSVRHLDDVGGSAAQRDVVEETLIHALMSGGRFAEATALLSARLDRRPSRLDRTRLGKSRHHER